MDTNRISSASIFLAIRRARFPILTMALTYLVAVLGGIGMAHSGSDPTITAMQNGQPLLAALSDFSSNLFLGSVPSTLGGLGVIFPYPLAAYCGWVGGIVSVDENHASRLAQPGDTIYYLVTLVLQLIPYSLAGGAGFTWGSLITASIPAPRQQSGMNSLGPRFWMLPGSTCSWSPCSSSPLCGNF